jgi:hypothetical protein
MNEVEKMYENAGIKPLCQIPDRYCGMKNVYEDFTAEKQLEIVKFLLHKGVYYDTDGDTYWFHYTDEIENSTYRPFEEAIAEFMNAIWQDLTEEERKQIKNILESEVRE